LIVGINSAAFDSPTPDFGKHFGLVHKTTLDELDVYLESLGREKTQLRICLIHHHPVSYSDPQPNIPDFSTLTNSENFFKVLSNHRFDVVIHGHKHVPHILHAPFISNGHPVTVLGAGSFSARLESQWVGTAQNQFHVIEIEGRDPETDVTYGHVATWDFVAGRWSDSHSHIGLCATENFGSLSTPKQLEDTIGMHVDTILAQKEMCEWRDLVLLTPRLAHSNTKVAYEAFINVGKKRGLENFGEVDAKGRKWALYRPPTRSKK
jgi:predicted phosphodiesterase